MKLIIIKGKSNIGKTNTICHIHELLKGYNNKIYDTYKDLHNDFICIYNDIEGIGIGLLSAGDYNQKIQEDIEFILTMNKNIDIIVCASRNYRKENDIFKKCNEKIYVNKGYLENQFVTNQNEVEEKFNFKFSESIIQIINNLYKISIKVS